MVGIGTIVNVVAVIAASIIGMLFSGGLKERFQETMKKACGLAVIFIGISGVLEAALSVNEITNKIEANGIMLMVFSIIIGGVIGELINIEGLLERLGEKLKKTVKPRSGNSNFTEGFVSASLIFCIGAMAIMGSFYDGALHDPTTLFIKSILDGVISLVLASNYGIGVAFSALTVGIYQGLLTLFFALGGGLMSAALITNLSLVGSVLIFAIGINLVFGNKIKVGNMLPALLIPVIYELFPNTVII